MSLPGSIHPDTGEPYTALDWSVPIATAPDWLIDWLLSQKVEKKSSASGDEAPRNECGKVPHGSIHGFMLKQAGRLRQDGLTREEIEPILLRLVYENCEPPIDDAKVEQMAKSICIYPPGEGDTSVKVGANARGAGVQQPEQPGDDGPDVIVENGITYAIIPHGNGFRRVALDTSTVCARPMFPDWVMKGTRAMLGKGHHLVR